MPPWNTVQKFVTKIGLSDRKAFASMADGRKREYAFSCSRHRLDERGMRLCRKMWITINKMSEITE